MDNHTVINKLKTPVFESLFDKIIFFEKTMIVDNGMDEKKAAKLGNLYMDAVHEYTFRNLKNPIKAPIELRDNTELYKSTLLRALQSQLIAYTWTQLYPRLPMKIMSPYAQYLLVSPDCIDNQTNTTLQTIINNIFN